MTDNHVVILAAGKGTRMKSAIPKVLHEAGGLPIIEHVLRIAAGLDPASTTVILGHQAGDVEAAIGKRQGLCFALQEPQLGTGHALLQAEPFLRGRRGTVVLLSGDVPLLRQETLRALLARHAEARAAATVLTAVLDDPAEYGRIVRDDGGLAGIVEHKDASAEQRRIAEVNSGIYAFELEALFDALSEIGSSNAQREYYLPDLVRIYRSRGRVVEAVIAKDPMEIMGVNSRRELATVAAILRERRLQALMESGVTIVDPATTYIGADVTIGADTIVHPGVHLEGRTTVGSDCVLHANIRIVDSTVEDGVVVNNFCVIVDSHVRRGARIGPFAHIRPQSDVGEDAHVGNFVELKKTSLGRGSKANHLAYLGDSTIGARVNVGAGTITCNYDGEKKHQTIIRDGAFIGSDTQLIAPVTVGERAYVGTGTTVREDVPAGALAVSAGKQRNIEGWVARKRGAAADQPKTSQ